MTACDSDIGISGREFVTDHLDFGIGWWRALDRQTGDFNDIAGRAGDHMQAIIGTGSEKLGMDQLINQEAFCSGIGPNVEARPHNRDSAGTEPAAALRRAFGVD